MLVDVGGTRSKKSPFSYQFVHREFFRQPPPPPPPYYGFDYDEDPGDTFDNEVGT